MIVDSSAASRRPAAEVVREWLSVQRVFISSAMADTAEERRTVADAVSEEGAAPLWFEEFGRDASAEEAYLTEVDSSTIYVGIANKLYGRLNPPGFSATEAEYMRARDQGKRLAFFVAADGTGREGHLARFVERVQVHITTELYADATDLARRIKKRLHQLAAEALSPWIKLGDMVLRADEIDDSGDTVTITARVAEPIAHELEAMRDQPHSRPRLRIVYGGRAVEGQLENLRRTTRAGSTELKIQLARVQPRNPNTMRAGTSNMSADDLVERGMRSLLFREPLPESVGMLASLAETGIDADDLRQAFDLPNEIAEGVTRLVITDGLVGSGRAARVVRVSVGPRSGDHRRLVVVWDAPALYANTRPERRTIEGLWARPAPESPTRTRSF